MKKKQCYAIFSYLRLNVIDSNGKLPHFGSYVN